MPTKKPSQDSVKVVVEKAMPGWTVVDKPARPKVASTVKADATAPSLAKMQSKVLEKKVKPVTFTEMTKHKGQFVTVRPTTATDASPAQEKVVLVRDGVVVARQG